MKLILHIGQQKTGTTSLQKFLFDNYDQLLIQNILYPKSLGTEHFKQHLLFRQRNDLFDSTLQLKEKLTKEISQNNAKTVIISDENLFFGKRINKNKIVAFLKSIFNEIEIWVYLRRQDLHAPSHYQQSLLGLVTRTFDEWIDHAIDSGYYDYYNVLNEWRSHFHNATFKIIPMTDLVRNDIRFDIIKKLNLNYNHFIFKKNQQLNKSVNWYIIPILRCFNIIILEQENELLKKVIKDIKSSFIKYSISIPEQSKLSLNKDQHNKIKSYCYQINNKLVMQFDLSQEKAIYLQNLHRDQQLNQVNFDTTLVSEFDILNDFIKHEFSSINFEDELSSISLAFKNDGSLDEKVNVNTNTEELIEYTKAIIRLFQKNKNRMEKEVNTYKPQDIKGKTLYFLHIAKCGGTSVRDYLNMFFKQGESVDALNPKMLSEYSEKEIKDWKLISGHLDRTVLNYIDPDITITWLRNPIDRLVSAYGRLAQLTKENREDFKKNEEAEKIALSFEHDQNYFKLSNSEFLRNSNLITKSLGSNFHTYDRFISSGDQKLKEAKRYLHKEIYFFGVMNRVQESMDLLSYSLGRIPQTQYNHSNKTNEKYKEEYKSKEMLSFFEKSSELDTQIWQYATDLFNERFNKTLHYLWSKYNGYNEEVNTNTNFNDIEYILIRKRLINYIELEIQGSTKNKLVHSIDYTFDLPLNGEGWSNREWYNDMTHYTLRWITQPKATIHFPLNRANLLECYIHIPHKVTDLKTIYIDDKPIDNIEHLEPHNYTKDVYHGNLIKFVIPISLEKNAFLTKIGFEVTNITSPNQLDKTNQDKDLKSISIDWIKISPLL